MGLHVLGCRVDIIRDKHIRDKLLKVKMRWLGGGGGERVALASVRETV